ncbi:MAG: hypothetical protein IKJ01_08825 [Lachnospiraceae bacterium]|nr:hypothetical protein [Lachnospiraceae bacterium]
MSKKVMKPIVLLVVFIAALAVFSILTNNENKDLTTTMKGASLPVMQFVYDDVVMNELHGYTQEMNPLFVRNSIIPLDAQRTLTMELMCYGQEVSGLSYEIRSMDSNRLLSNDEIQDYTIEGEKISCQLQLPTLLTNNEEYIMIWKVLLEEDPVYYYTRIIFETDCYTKECLDFALQFHGYTFREDADEFIPTYMDPATGDATTLQYVDLACTLKQLTWAEFTGVKLTEPVAYFQEINDSYNVITLSYIMTNVNEANETEYYNVEEYYRLRQTSQRMYVLNFERTMEQIFRGENDFLINDNAILLGIRNNDIEYLANDSGDCVAFVQQGELWCYDGGNNIISQVFGFRSAEGMDNRENYDQHDIKIIRVDEAGSIDFIVYGYMNRGIHEGKVGIGVYHYDGLAHTIEEEVFIPSVKSYEVLKAELGKLLYVNEQKILYFIWNSNLYRVDLNTYDVTVELEDMTEECFAVSESSRYFAWVEQEVLYSSQKIQLADFKTGKIYEIKTEDNTYLRPLAFVGEDFVYGIAKISDIITNVSGNTIFPMCELKILNTSEDKQDVIKTYVPSNGYIGKTTVDKMNIYIDLVSLQNGYLIKHGEDTIMNREPASGNEVYIKEIVTNTKQTQMTLRMKEQNISTVTNIIIPKQILLEEARIAEIMPKDSDEWYYVYVKGEVVLATEDISYAIKVANQHLGIILNEQQKYIWKRSRDTQKNVFTDLSVNESDASANSLIQSMSIILMRENMGQSVSHLVQEGNSPREILQSALPDMEVFELHGSTTEELLYFIHKGTPVLAMTGKNEAVLLIGYSANRIYYYNPQNHVTSNLSYEEADTMFAQSGSRFFVYVK